MEQLVRIGVGEPWLYSQIPDREGVLFQIWDSSPCFLLFYDQPTEHEIECVNRGKLGMGCYFVSPILFILLNIHGFTDGWMDAPFSIRVYDDQDLGFSLSTDIPPDQGMNINLFLIDRISKKVCAIRNFTTSHDFAIGFRHKCWQQLQEPFSMAIYSSVVSKAYMDLSSKEMAHNAEHIFYLKGSLP